MHCTGLSITSLALFSVCLAPAQIPDPSEVIAITSAPPWLATGELYLAKSDPDAPGLKNPVLVVEGFDLDNSMDWPELYELLNQENLVEDIQAFGRDLVILNFGDSTDDIVANSALTETAINYINANRNDSTDKFTAIGASLGALTVRKALVDMPNHNVDTWISFDGPHEGANIPLGLQEYLEFFASENDAANALLAILDRPAARQMLLIHHSHPDGLTGGSLPERSDYAALMNATGYPTSSKGIAISNGSGLGEKLPFEPDDTIIHWTDSGFLKPTITANIYALPRTSATVFSGSITFIIPIGSATVNSYHPLSFDNAPGGTRPTFLQLYTNIPPDQISGDDYLTTTNHCFIPTVSALGIPIEHLETNLSSHAELLALSPFDEIHYAISNEEHVEINARNKRWIMRTILEDRDSDDDGWDDYQEYLMGTDYASAESQASIELAIATQSSSNLAQVAWAALPNTQYEVWYTDELGSPWAAIDTVSLTPLSGTTNQYTFPTTNSAGFYAVSGIPVDPVSD